METTIEMPAPSSILHPPSSRPRLADLEAGAHRLALILAARQLRSAVPPLDWKTIGRKLSIPHITIFKWCAQVAHLPHPTPQDCAPDHSTGRPRKHHATDQDKAALAAAYLITNRTETTGSAEEAARIALRKGQLSDPLATQLRARDAANQSILPQSIRHQITAPEAVVKQFRNPTDAGLDYIYAPGSLKLIKDPVTGEERFARAGDILEADDSTINFPVCVPWDRAGLPGHPCADRYGVIVGRFQWLVAIDVGEMYVPGFSYTARPRSSYRGEDILSLLHTIFKQHGLWQRCRFEQGVFKSDLVTNALKKLGIQLTTVHSPHAKAFIEGLFNLLWTKLSDIPGQVGRYQGEMEEENKLLTSCQRGATDPRKHFPMLADAIAAFTRAIQERNTQWVNSQNYGSWIPEQRWTQRKDEGRLTPLDPQREWLFSPCVRTWTVRGAQLGGTIPFFEGLSIRFDFGASWLSDYHGCEVQAYFDPFAPECPATLVLAQDTRDHKAGEILGQAEQINKVARYARRMFAYGQDEDRGITHIKRAAQALRREVRAILPGGRPGITTTNMRDGLGTAAQVTTGHTSDPSHPSHPSDSGLSPRASRLSPAEPVQRGCIGSEHTRLTRLAEEALLANLDDQP
jgi:hypothetical protein